MFHLKNILLYLKSDSNVKIKSVIRRRHLISMNSSHKDLHYTNSNRKHLHRQVLLFDYIYFIRLHLMGVKLDVDLRNTGEKGSSPDLGKYGIGRTPQNYDYRNHADNLQNAEKVRGTLDSVMTYVLEDKPVYLHCSIGSDRTGYFSMLIESLIGVCQNWTDADYELTSFASSITYDARLRTETNDSGGQYKTGLDFLSQFNGVTLHDKAYDYVVTSSSGLKMDKTKVDSFIEKMKE